MLGHRALGEGPLSALLDATLTTTSTRTVRFATRTFVTRPTDAPAHQAISGRIQAGLRLSRRLTTATGGQFGGLIETNFGEVQLTNTDGVLDHFVTDYAADGRTVRLKIGSTEFDAFGHEQVQPYAAFATVYTTVAGDWTFEHDIVRLRIGSELLDTSTGIRQSRLRGRIQGSTYAGTGGIEGTADLAGRTKPLTFGRCLNVSPQLIDPAILTYHLHSDAIDSIEAVYDRGVAVAFDVDYPSYALLAAASMSTTEQTYATCLADGCFRLGIGTNIGQITADLRGDIDNINGAYVGRHASISRMILRDYGNLASAELDLDSFTAFNDSETGEIGLFLPSGDQSIILDVLELIALSGGAFIGQDRSGLYRIQRLDPPSATVVHWAFDDRDIIAIERLPLPYRVPWKSWGVGYETNWTVQGDSDVAAGVEQSRRQFLQSAKRYVYATNANIALFHLTSAGMVRESLFLSSDQAVEESVRLIGFYSYGRALYRVAVKNALFSVELGQTIHLTYDRWDLAAGKRFIAVEIEDDADRVETTLTVFG